MSDATQVVSALAMTAVILMAGTAFITEVDQNTEGFKSDQSTPVEFEGDGAQLIPPGDGAGYSETVVNSRGRARAFTGANDSYLSAQSSVEVFSGNNWTVSQGILRVDDLDATTSQTVLAVGDPSLFLRWHGNGTSTGFWSATWTTVDTSHQVNVSADTPSDGAFIQVTRNGSTLTIFRDGVAGESADLSTSSTIAGNLTTAKNFDGVLDETRTFDDTLNSSQRTQLRNSPVAPLPGTNRTARIMFDTNGTSLRIYFTDVDATANNTTVVDGYAGTELSAQSDYSWVQRGPEIVRVSGGAVEGAPAVFVDYTFEGTEASLRHSWIDTMEWAEFIPVLFMIVFLLGFMAKFRRQ